MGSGGKQPYPHRAHAPGDGIHPTGSVGPRLVPEDDSAAHGRAPPQGGIDRSDRATVAFVMQT